MEWVRETQTDSFDEVRFDSYCKKNVILPLSSAIVNSYAFYDGAVDLKRSQCTVSDSQVTVKAHGPLVRFPYWT